ncbi:hypothetical protein RSEGYP2_32 [Ralstonia phage RsoP1EGY]|uniref:Uncharacterized protein n=1 Tax=Ralstonia phage RsoP1EGY TaxID=2070026 RepID=A0A2R2ZGF9_9CAUD|nr:hypothetical protein HOT00_gp32 [Ralstonia phage RsoP1EGY]AUO78191.1 hypothetical protein RSEGYP2_32 [Ralstonia phage RsoP1EGY]
MSEALRPHSLRIMGRKFRVSYKDDLDGDLGYCEPTKCKIEIENGQHPVEEADTVLHEVLHAVFYLMDIGLSAEEEEHVVRKVVTGLTQVFQDNPRLLTYLANAK